MWSGLIKRRCLMCALLFLSVIITFFAGRAFAGPDYGGRLRMVNEGDSFGFDAIKARAFSATGQIAGNLVMERLFELGSGDQLIPVLGLSAVPSENRKTWTITLRSNVVFHDGTPFNADAVVTHWKRILNPANRFRGMILLSPLVSVEKTGEYEVKFLLKHAWEPFLSMVLTNKHSLSALIPSPRAVENDTQNRAPVGTGPFIFKEWKTGDRMLFSRNPDYHVTGKPYLDEIVIRLIPDQETRYMALVSGQVDMIATDRPSHVKKLVYNPDYTTIISDTGGTGILMMNTAKPPLDDVRVRQALALAWDQEQYIKVVFKNTVKSAQYINEKMLPCNDFGYPNSDLNKAKQLIADFGKPVELEYFHSRTQRGKETAMVMQQLFKKIGVTIKPSPLDWGGIMKMVFGKKFDIASWVIPGYDDMGPVITAFFTSKSKWNLMGYENKEIDELLLKQRMSSDPNVRRQSLCDAARIINKEAPFLYLFKQRFYMAAKKNIKGLVPPINEHIRLADAWIEK